MPSHVAFQRPNTVPAPSGTTSGIRPQTVTQADVIGSTDWDAPDVDVSLSRYVDVTDGGQTGTVTRLGYTDGFGTPWRSRGMGGMMVQLPATEVGSYGPVGVDNYQAEVSAGVRSQFEQEPTLEEIYQSMAGGL